MGYSDILARLRKEKGYTQPEAAEYISKYSGRTYSNKNISSWETGVAEPSNELFLLLCELYGVGDIQATFRGIKPEYRGMAKLNTLGKNRVEEYIALLSNSPLFAEMDTDDYDNVPQRYIKLYDIPVAAGFGEYLDSDSYVDLEVDETVPEEASFAVRVSGDSMSPRFVDNQIIFIKQQQMLDIGDIGIFELAGNAYIKKLGRGELISLNTRYKPIPIHEYDSFHILGKVIG